MTDPTLKRLIVALVLVLASMATEASLVAAQIRYIGPGYRVRITAPSLFNLREAVGTVEEVTDEALIVHFRSRRRVLTLDRSKIETIEVSTWRGRKGGRMLVGLLVGVGSGILWGRTMEDDPPGVIRLRTEEKQVILAVVLGFLGAAITSGRSDTWASALPTNVDLTVLPLMREHGTGLHVGLALPFH